MPGLSRPGCGRQPRPCARGWSAFYPVHLCALWATALRARLEQERIGWIASRFARAYAAVAGAMIERADTQGRSALALELLTLAGHPFVTEPDFLLHALKPAAGVDFGDNVGAAARWAAKTYGIRPDQLRPPPLPR